MTAFARKIDYRFACLLVDKKFVTSSDQVRGALETQLRDFLIRNEALMSGYGHLKIYYDCGQPEVTNVLHGILEERLADRVEFAQGVDPQKYKMFQVADLMCTVKLIEQKLKLGLHMTESEERFFGGPRDFKRNVLRRLKAKEL